jgi:branched-chain amino acid transport system substrate-binding protein
MWSKVLRYTLPITICLIFIIALIPGCKEKAVEKDKIVIGASRSLEGPNAIYEQAAFGPIYKMWVDDVNAAGGIYVKEYNKKLPIEMKVYDDKSDVSLMTRNIEKLIVEDKVDFLFGPPSTAFLFAGAPIANKYNKLMLCAEGGATTLEPMLPDLPYVFSVLNYSNHYQLPVFADILKEVGAKSAYIMFLADLHGAEYNLTAQSEFTKNGISIYAAKSVPVDIKDVDPIIKEAKASNVDVFCSFAYLDQSALAIKSAIALDYNPKAIIIGPGGCFGLFKAMFGPAAEGVICEGAWNRKSSPLANEFADKMVARYGEAGMGAFGDKEAMIDWWGHLVYYSALQHFQQSIEKAGTLDNKKVRDVMAKEKFDTYLGPMWWQIHGDGGGLLPQECYAGQIGQWQKGVFEVIDTGTKRTAAPVYPKPAWPK